MWCESIPCSGIESDSFASIQHHKGALHDLLEIVACWSERGAQVSRTPVFSYPERMEGNILPLHVFFVSLPVILKNPGPVDTSGNLHLTFGGLWLFSHPEAFVVFFGFCLLGGTWRFWSTDSLSLLSLPLEQFSRSFKKHFKAELQRSAGDALWRGNRLLRCCQVLKEGVENTLADAAPGSPC